MEGTEIAAAIRAKLNKQGLMIIKPYYTSEHARQHHGRQQAAIQDEEIDRFQKVAAQVRDLLNHIQPYLQNDKLLMEVDVIDKPQWRSITYRQFFWQKERIIQEILVAQQQPHRKSLLVFKPPHELRTYGIDAHGMLYMQKAYIEFDGQAFVPILPLYQAGLSLSLIEQEINDMLLLLLQALELTEVVESDQEASSTIEEVKGQLFQSSPIYVNRLYTMLQHLPV